MGCYIIKFSDNYYLRLDNGRRYKTKDIDKAFVYFPYSTAVNVLKFMKQKYPIMKDCIVVNKNDEIARK